jgi:hypothetical protein
MQRSKGMTPRVGHNSCRPVNVLYYMNPTEAPPEAWRDDGRADGILPRTLADVERETQERFARLTALAPEPNNRSRDTGKTVTLYPVDGGPPLPPFPSVTAAARFAGVHESKVRYALKKRDTHAGYRWAIG